MPPYQWQPHTILGKHFERLVTTPTIVPKPHPIPHPNLKLSVGAKSFPFHSNTPPKTTTMRTPTQLRRPSPHSSPNLIAMTHLQSLVSSTPNCHSHFPSKVLLMVVIFLIPNPSFAIGAHSLSQPN